MNDHERGCQGREYVCTCGYDDKREAEVTRLLSALSEAEKERDELRAAKWKQQHVDTMNDMVSMGMAIAAANAELEQARNALKKMHRRSQKAEGALLAAKEVLAGWDKTMEFHGIRLPSHDLLVRTIKAELDKAISRALITDTGRTEDGHRVGEQVNKTSGYPFPGEVRSAFTNKAGDLRYVVEATGTDYAGMLHIFSPAQLADTGRTEGEQK